MAVISAVITCYNYEQWLGEAIESVLAQTRPVDEIVVVDDASTDNSLAVASTYGDVQAIAHPINRGAPAARNSGIAAAQGDLIWILDADDRAASTYCEKTSALLEAQPDVSLVFTWMRQFGTVESGPHKPVPNPKLLSRQHTLFGCYLMRKKVWEACRERNGFGFHPAMPQGIDWEFHLHAIVELGFKAAVVPEVLYFWRRHSGSLCTDWDGPRVRWLLVKLHPELYQDVDKRKLEAWIG